MSRVLFVCTGNLCRSPSAAWFLSELVRQHGPPDVEVQSVGTIQAIGGPPEDLLTQGTAFGLDLSHHTPRQMTPDDIATADLVIGMTRQHVREAVVLEPSVLRRAFTLREVVRRADEVGSRPAPVSLADWVGQVSGARGHIDLVGESADDDIADPMGGPPEGYRDMLTEVSTLTTALYGLAWGAATPAAEVI